MFGQFDLINLPRNAWNGLLLHLPCSVYKRLSVLVFYVQIKLTLGNYMFSHCIILGFDVVTVYSTIYYSVTLYLQGSIVTGSTDKEVKFWDFELITDEKFSSTRLVAL